MENWDSFFPSLLKSYPKGKWGNPNIGPTSLVPAHLNSLPSSTHLCPTSSQVLATETIAGVTSSIFTLSGLNPAPNIQVTEVIFFRKKNRKAEQLYKGFLLLLYRNTQEKKITWKSNRDPLSQIQTCLYSSDFCLFVWVNITVFKPQIVLLLSGQQGCRMFLDLHDCSWWQWEDCPWRCTGAHGETEGTKTTCWLLQTVQSKEESFSVLWKSKVGKDCLYSPC